MVLLNQLPLSKWTMAFLKRYPCYHGTISKNKIRRQSIHWLQTEQDWRKMFDLLLLTVLNKFYEASQILSVGRYPKKIYSLLVVFFSINAQPQRILSEWINHPFKFLGNCVLPRSHAQTQMRGRSGRTLSAKKLLCPWEQAPTFGHSSLWTADVWNIIIYSSSIPGTNEGQQAASLAAKCKLSEKVLCQ